EQELEVARLDLLRAEVDVQRVFVEPKIRRELDQTARAKANAAREVRPGVAAPAELHDERVAPGVVEDLGLATFGEEASHHGLVVVQLQGGAPLHHLVAEAVQAEA